ncbi:sensor histidine kinase [Ramlibacter tataouinensis]|uniref:histidine kinase n=1 Tax=Ramlibacter tataouinensis (strain ATCC BAA-407 / DSM 14655 / LMG 21543 / TTB310) TaxID=365046 RepID=F5XYE0_RAMTT|nr:HAMP domain-containing sensor histidine kinase [Ramlibacter tataouinensis]AEG91933.1 candidate histidine kinase, classic [Ramlibacter tataouinensis TTB310]
MPAPSRASPSVTKFRAHSDAFSVEPSIRAQAGRWLKEEVVKAPWVPVLHPSPLRMKGLGVFTLLGHPLFWWLWGRALPQPYENLALRLLTAALGLLLMSPRIFNDPASRLSGQVFSAVIWLELPFLFSWMYLCNGGNSVWLASVAAMILTYYFVTDWRIATLGLLLAAVGARALFELVGPAAPPIPTPVALANTVVIAFCVSMGMLLGVSSANLRREHLAHTLATMGIMAHELRTPLATMALIGDAMRGAADTCPPTSRGTLEKLAERLHMLVRNMNHQIDMQIANARLLRLPGHKDAISAADLVRSTVFNYPFRSSRERESVRLQVRRDFQFAGSEALFGQVLDNLLKNALRSMAAAGTLLQPGDVQIEVDAAGKHGRIRVADRGVGIDPQLQPRIFEPFFSTNRGTGHGLGLAFSHRVVQRSGGHIRVESEPGRGATFTIELPLLA